ncbi:MAG: indole-3-glycerol phosphate synthase TrpC, partial [Phycisphaerales bacterium]|nr:indole-3-glycerol phosphate synthase TrpC [Phycisphaerales bacterium]
MSGFLDNAFAEAHRRVERWRRDDLLGALRDTPAARSSGGGLAAALRVSSPIALIAEIKRASPSRGMLCADVDVASRARLYVDAGAAAVSVLTESRWFKGSIDDFVAARRATRGPLLRKDFMVDEYDLQVSAAIGADAVLLIAARFDAIRLRELLAFAGGLGLEALVETHAVRDAATACEAGASIIGVNSRNLQTLQVDVEGALGALRLIPPDRLR